MKKDNITGIILAGGQSLRMGKNKALIELNGRPMITWIHETLKSICNDIIVSANDIHVYSFLKEKIITDKIAGLGPIGGIYSCLKESSSTKNFVLACDIPFVSGELIKHIIGYKDGAEFVLPEWGKGNIEPLCAVYDKSVIVHLENMIDKNDLKIQNLMKHCTTKILTLDENQFDITQFQNMNRPEDIYG